MNHAFRQELTEFMAAGRKLGLIDTQFDSAKGSGGKYLSDHGQPILDCTRMDYLGIGEDPIIKNLMLEAIRQNDIGCPASQIITKPSLIAEFEEKVSHWQKLSKSWIFTSGYSVNNNILQALGLRFRSPHLTAYMRKDGIGRKTRDMRTIFFTDRHSHYSMMHGIRVACKFQPGLCESYRYDCENIASLEEQLERKKELLADNLGIIVADTLISANGRVVDIRKLYQLAEQYNCLLYLDEAHASGVLGKDGRGVSHELLDDPTVDRKRMLVMGTFTKAFSQLGGYVSIGDENLAYMLRAGSPKYVFSAPILPWMASVLSDTIDILGTTWGLKKRRSLQKKSDFLRKKLIDLGLDTMGSKHHIVPVLIGDEGDAFSLQEKLRSKGYHIAVFQYPSVQRGKAILRFSVCDDMDYAELDSFSEALKDSLYGTYRSVANY